MIVIVLAFRRPPSAPTLWLFAIGRMPARSVGELDIDATGRTAVADTAAASVPTFVAPERRTRLYANTHCAAEPQRLTPTMAALVEMDTLLFATRVPRELLSNVSKHWGGYMIAVG